VSYRNCWSTAAIEKFDVTTKPPHEIPEEREQLPAEGQGRADPEPIMDRSRKLSPITRSTSARAERR
jgi:hypothetical protein